MNDAASEGPLQPTTGSSPQALDVEDMTSGPGHSFQRDTRQIFAGSLLILGLVVVWIADAELIQWVLKDTPNNSTLFMRLAAQSCTTLLLPLCYWRWRLLRRSRRGATIYSLSSAVPSHQTHNESYERIRRTSNSSSISTSPSESANTRTVQHRQALKSICMRVIPYSFFYTTMGYTWYLSLQMTTVATNTALYQTYVLFSFLFSVLLIGERVTVAKSASVLSAFVGVAIIAFATGMVASWASAHGLVVAVKQNSDTPEGILLSLLSAILYASVQVGYSRWIDHYVARISDNFTGTLLVTGLQGLVTFVFWGPIMLLLADVSGLEPFQWPGSFDRRYWLGVAINGVTAILYQPIMFGALRLTSPAYVSVGCTLTIPASMLIDIAIHGTAFTWLQVLGTGFVMAGIIGLLMTMRKDAVKKNSDEE